MRDLPQIQGGAADVVAAHALHDAFLKGATLKPGVLVTADVDGEALVLDDQARVGMMIENRGSVDVYVGPAGVAVATGSRIGPGEERQFYAPFCPTNALSVVAASGTCSVFAQELVRR